MSWKESGPSLKWISGRGTGNAHRYLRSKSGSLRSPILLSGYEIDVGANSDRKEDDG